MYARLQSDALESMVAENYPLREVLPTRRPSNKVRALVILCRLPVEQHTKADRDHGLHERKNAPTCGGYGAKGTDHVYARWACHKFEPKGARRYPVRQRIPKRRPGIEVARVEDRRGRGDSCSATHEG